MIQKTTLLVPSDKSGVWLLRVIHTYTKLSKTLQVNNFGKASIIKTSPWFITFKKKKKKFLYIRSGLVALRKCGLSYKAPRSGLLLQKRLTPVGRRVSGFISKNVRRKRAISSFIKIL